MPRYNDERDLAQSALFSDINLLSLVQKDDDEKV